MVRAFVRIVESDGLSRQEHCGPTVRDKSSDATNRGTIHFVEYSAFVTLKANHENIRKQDCPHHWRRLRHR
jgi:hypothetical protein